MAALSARLRVLRPPQVPVRVFSARAPAFVAVRRGHGPITGSAAVSCSHVMVGRCAVPVGATSVGNRFPGLRRSLHTASANSSSTPQQPPPDKNPASPPSSSSSSDAAAVNPKTARRKAQRAWYIPLLNEACRLRDGEAARNVMAQVRASGETPNAFFYERMIYALGSTQQWALLAEVLGEALRTVGAKEVFFSTAIAQNAAEGRVAEAQKVSPAF